jgi:predicted anti-sigma-YlaC factor YlaD
MPDVAHHRTEWTPEEAAHLAGCAECRAEWQLVLAARGLDEGAPTVSDPSALPAALRRRLAEDRIARARARRAWSFAGAAVAAAAILAVVTGRDPGPAETAPAVAEAGALVPLPELEGLEAAQLDTLLQSLDRPVAGTSTLDASTLGEYEDGELEQVFASWEG